MAGSRAIAAAAVSALVVTLSCRSQPPPQAPSAEVTPTPAVWARPDLSRFSDAAVSDTVRRIFQNNVRHGFGFAYFSSVYPRTPVDGLVPCNPRQLKYGGALAFLGALAVRVPGAWQPDSDMNDYDEMGAPGQVGENALTLAEVEARTRQLIRSFAACHTGNGGRAFGPDAAGNNLGGFDSWQTAEKVALIGTAGWLMDDRLSPDEQALVAAMVRRQLTDRLLDEVDYWNGRDGNSRLEEEAGQAAFLSLGTVMFPDDPDIGARREKLLRHWLGSTARPSDRTSDAVIHGRRVGDLVRGFNLREDGAVINHGRYFPQYQATVAWSLFSATHWAAAGRGIPQGALFNADFVYRAFVDSEFPAGGADPMGITGRFIAPGGTIYQRDTWKFYAPNGLDAAGPAGYGYRDMSFVAGLDAAVDKLNLSGRASIPAKVWLERHHGAELLRMQLRAEDRRCFTGEYRKDLVQRRNVTRAPGVFTGGDVEHPNGAREGQCIRNMSRAYLVQALDLPPGWTPFNAGL